MKAVDFSRFEESHLLVNRKVIKSPKKFQHSTFSSKYVFLLKKTSFKFLSIDVSTFFVVQFFFAQHRKEKIAINFLTNQAVASLTAVTATFLENLLRGSSLLVKWNLLFTEERFVVH